MKKTFHRLCTGVLIMSLVGTSGIVPQGMFHEDVVKAQVTDSSALKVNDHMQVFVDGESAGSMQLYKNGVYETGLTLQPGSHTVRITKNGNTYEDGIVITVEESKKVYVRVMDGEVIDSVNQHEQFHTAAWVGNLSGLAFYEDGNSYSIGEWSPSDDNAELAYQGGGIFSRTFYFAELEKDINLEYKVALDNGWDVAIGDDGANVSLTIPAGTNKVTVYADLLNGVVYDSLHAGMFEVTQNDESVYYPAFDYVVSLIGSARDAGDANWDLSAEGFEFTRLSDSLYIYQKNYEKGPYEYKVGINYEKWYEKSGNKSLTIETDNTQVVFLYDAADQSLYDSVNDGAIVAEKLGMKQEEAVSKVVNNANGTTKFVTAQAKETDSVELVYAPKDNVSDITRVPMKKGVTSRGDFNGTFVSDDIFLGDHALDYVFYYEMNGKVVLDNVADVVMVDGKSYSQYKREAFEGRLITVPGTFPGKSWDASTNDMEYLGNGLYVYTFKDVPAANYEFKIATGTWAENYGKEGITDGSNYSVVVPEKQDVTIYYMDIATHRAVTSLNYKVMDISLKGDGVDTVLTDDGLTGIYQVKVPLKSGTYSNLVMSYEGKKKEIYPIQLDEDKEITFYFDPSTEIFYNDSAKVPVNKESVKYDSKDQAYKSVYGAVEEGEKVRFSIDTDDNATQVQLIVKGKEFKNIELSAKQEGSSKRWSAEVAFDSYGQYTYFFAVYYRSYVQIYCDDDGYYGTGTLTDLSLVKPYDLIVYKKGYETPDWMKNAVIYQIFPDRFMNGNKDNDEAQKASRGDTNYEFVKDWYAYPENPSQEELHPETYPEQAWSGDGIWNNEMYGGDLQGITERMDYLKALGVNVIYLNPVFASISSHRYDATDYKKIDPILGDLGDFDELVEAAKKNGMHIVLDGVFNHVSDDSVYFDRYYRYVGQDGKIGAYPYWAFVYDSMEADKELTMEQAEAKAKAYFSNMGVRDFSYTEWFQVNRECLKDDKGKPVADTIGERAGLPVYGYEGWWGYDSMPVIKSTGGSEYQTGNWAEEIIEGSDSVGQYWIRQGSDGWRLDVANEVSDETWQHFRNSVKGLNSEAVIIGEIWDDATQYILGDMYDSVMNYVFRDAVLAYAKGGNAKDSIKKLERIRERYPREAFYAMMNLVGSHDTTRLLSFLDGIDDDRKQTEIDMAFPTYEKTSDKAKQSQYLVAFIQMTYPGAPTIYYGDELGMVGADDPDDRRAMIWGCGNKELVEWYAKLANIRHSYQALNTGDIIPVDMADEAFMSYIREDDKDTMVVITNNSASEKTVSYQLPEQFREDGIVLTDLISGKTYVTDGGMITVKVPSYRGVILTDHVKEIIVDSEGLKPGYDESYKVEEEQKTETPAPPTTVTPTTVAPTSVPSTKPTVSTAPTASAKPEVSKKPEVSVKPSKAPVKKVPSLKVKQSTYKVTLGAKSFNLKASATGDGKITYSSSNKKVATVSSTGKVTVKRVGTAVITIKVSETKKYKAAKKAVTVIVNPKKIGCVVKKQSDKKQSALLVKWRPREGMTGYEIEYAKKPSFQGKKSVKVKGKRNVTIRGLKKGTTYYVRIRTYQVVDGKKYYSAYSEVHKKRV